MEIGSEFSTNSAIYGQNEYFELSNYSKRYVLSGRTGLHLIAEEVKEKVSTIALPDYCCGSMIAPFIKQGFHLSFYKAFDLHNVMLDKEVQAVLVMDYFGFLSKETLDFTLRCKEEKKVVIVDATQTAFSHFKTYDLADYIVVSYRKWLDSLCAVVYSKNGFHISENSMEHPSYIETWRTAASLKENYLKGLFDNKQEFLTLFTSANHALDLDYAGYKANEAEISVMRMADSLFIRKTRRENAKYLIDEIKKLSEIFEVQLMFDEMRMEDCPLVVPILVNEKKRSVIRNELIKNNIYCPIHWPIDQRYPYHVTLYHQKELSLICDQRYSLEEMKRQILILSQALTVLEN